MVKTSIEKYKVGREGPNFYDVVVRNNKGQYKKRITTTNLKEARLIEKRVKKR